MIYLLGALYALIILTDPPWAGPPPQTKEQAAAFWCRLTRDDVSIPSFCPGLPEYGP